MNNTPRGLPLTRAHVEQIFPKLTPAQIRRITPRGQMRAMERGEVLYEQGESAVPFFVVVSGELEIVRPWSAPLRPLSPSIDLVSSLVRSSRSPAGGLFSACVLRSRVRVIEVDRQHMLALVQSDAELGQILMRAFILRRVELVAAGVGDVVLIGSTHSAGTLRIKEFLMRNGHPYTFIDLERDPDVQNLLDNFHITASEIPVVICRGKVVLRNPSNQANRRLPWLQRSY